MSIRAYKRINDVMQRNGEIFNIHIIENDEFFNVTHNPEVYEIFEKYGNTYTDVDCMGYMEISYESLEDIIKFYEGNGKIFPETMSILKDIFTELDKSGEEFIGFECY